MKFARRRLPYSPNTGFPPSFGHFCSWPVLLNFVYGPGVYFPPSGLPALTMFVFCTGTVPPGGTWPPSTVIRPSGLQLVPASMKMFWVRDDSASFDSLSEQPEYPKG